MNNDVKKIYEDEVQLKKDLDKLGFRFGDRFSTVGFVVSFIDRGSGAEIYQVAQNSPINALRLLPSLLEQKKLGVDDVDVIIEFAYDLSSRAYSDVGYKISPYMYFKKQKVQVKTEKK